MPNYFNPVSVRPSDNLPLGATQGYNQVQDRQKFDQMMKLQAMLQQDSLQRQQMETQAYGLDTPVRAAERGAKIPEFGLRGMVAKETMPFAGDLARGKRGEANSLEAKGQF